ncbi:MAG: hypothetical protein DIU74_010560, partial [Pseudomonadota bacterium]
MHLLLPALFGRRTGIGQAPLRESLSHGTRLRFQPRQIGGGPRPFFSFATGLLLRFPPGPFFCRVTCSFLRFTAGTFFRLPARSFFGFPSRAFLGLA